MTNIVICCDGTWNTSDQKDGGVPVPTNVARLFNATAEEDEIGQKQHKYYHPGVGSGKSFFDKIVGGGTGLGLNRNIMSAYYELTKNYKNGDKIFLFGFSRGAYTVRSLAGFISHCGLLDTRHLESKEGWKQVNTLFQDGYRKHKTPQWPTEYQFHDPKPLIDFLGVWDTVGALGIPDDLAFLNLLEKRRDYTFYDTTLSSSINIARHALSLDEQRASFQPTLWKADPKQDAEEKWFPGAHSDVGGGYREHGLSDAALDWMIQEAGKAGLAFDIKMICQIPRNKFQDVLHDPCEGLFGLMATMPRAVPNLPLSPAILAKSTQRRMEAPPIAQAPYRPQATCPLDKQIFADKPWNETGLWLEADQEYRFDATGEWMDGDSKCKPSGFQRGRLVHWVSSALSLAEGLFKKITGNESANFFFTRRHDKQPWLVLMGAIANGGIDVTNGKTVQHETFFIGDGATYTPKKSGYFYAYANDAWGFYRNNRGHVWLKVQSIP